MYMYVKAKAANHTTIVVAQHGLLFDVLPFSAVPVAVELGYLGVVGCKAVPIAIIVGLYLAREFVESPSAMSARRSYLIRPPRLCGHSLPLDVAISFFTRHLNLARPFVKGLAADRARAPLFPPAIVAVVLAAMLMAVYVSILLRAIFLRGHDFAAAASAVEGGVLIYDSVHKSIIHA